MTKPLRQIVIEAMGQSSGKGILPRNFQAMHPNVDLIQMAKDATGKRCKTRAAAVEALHGLPIPQQNALDKRRYRDITILNREGVDEGIVRRIRRYVTAPENKAQVQGRLVGQQIVGVADLDASLQADKKQQGHLWKGGSPPVSKENRAKLRRLQQLAKRDVAVSKSRPASLKYMGMKEGVDEGEVVSMVGRKPKPKLRLGAKGVETATPFQTKRQRDEEMVKRYLAALKGRENVVEDIELDEGLLRRISRVWAAKKLKEEIVKQPPYEAYKAKPPKFGKPPKKCPATKRHK